MVEQEVDVEILPADLEVVLAGEEGEALAEFEQQVLYARDQPALDVALVCSLPQRQEVELIGVLERLLG